MDTHQDLQQISLPPHPKSNPSQQIIQTNSNSSDDTSEDIQDNQQQINRQRWQKQLQNTPQSIPINTNPNNIQENNSQNNVQQSMENCKVISNDHNIQKKYTHEQKQKKYQKNKQYTESFDLHLSSTYNYASYFLLYQDLLLLLKPLNAFLQFDLFLNNNKIRILYNDKSKQQQLKQKIQDLILQVVVLQLDKHEAKKGVLMSSKYMKNLKKQQITIFQDQTQKFKSQSYYICGKVSSKKILLQKITQIKNMSFSYFYLIKYQNTRTYRAIFRAIFHTPQIHTFIQSKFKSRQIQVADIRKCAFPIPYQRNNIVVLLTSHLDRKSQTSPIRYKQADSQITKYIQQTYLCFTFVFRQQQYTRRYIPKIDRIIYFIISQKKHNFKTSYLHIIIKKYQFQSVRSSFIQQISKLKLNIYGRRYFKYLLPQKPNLHPKCDFKIVSFPPNQPYSWTLTSKINAPPFNWIDHFKIQKNI